LILAVLVYAPMLVEAALSARNERALRARGAVEPPNDVYPIMRVGYPALFLAMIIEAAMRGAAAPTQLALGVALFAAAKLLKYWAIAALGSFWSFRVLVVPRARLVTTGPYRLLRHPNYVGVLGELVGAAAMTNARIVGPIAVILFGALLYRRIAIEERALGI
jgi:methyltransferase